MNSQGWRGYCQGWKLGLPAAASQLVLISADFCICPCPSVSSSSYIWMTEWISISYFSGAFSQCFGEASHHKRSFTVRETKWISSLVLSQRALRSPPSSWSKKRLPSHAAVLKTRNVKLTFSPRPSLKRDSLVTMNHHLDCCCCLYKAFSESLLSESFWTWGSPFA